jgi:hypothetical protein
VSPSGLRRWPSAISTPASGRGCNDPVASRGCAPDNHGGFALPDPEIEAMTGVAESLAALDDEARSRVLRWAAEKFGVGLPRARQNGRPEGTSSVDADNSVRDVDEDDVSADDGPGQDAYKHFAELFSAVDPKNEMEKAMTAAYWIQVVQGKNEWQSQSLNKELKDLGHYISTINKALTAGIEKRPALVLQLKKSGATRQGRKTYKLSGEGIKYIRGRIS